jgi:hypothetical protein
MREPNTNMKMTHTKTLFLSALCSVAALTLFVTNGCVKNTTAPPVHDTTVVIKTDTLTVPPPPDPTVNLTKGLLLYLPFSGNIVDSSGNNNPTTASGSVLTYDAHGYANNAFGATGNGERVYVTNNGSIKFDTAYTVSMGFMMNVVQQQYYLSIVDPTTGKGPSFVVGNCLAGTSSVVVGTEDVTLGCDAYGTNDNINITDTLGFVPVAGSWYNLISIYHRGSIQTYINGKLIASKTGGGTLSNLCPASRIVIGAWWDGQPLSMNGKLDNIRLYNRVLTPHEIATLSGSYQVTSNSVQRRLQTH